MNYSALNLFLSEGNIRRHLDHHNSTKLKLTVLEKSIPAIKGKDVFEVSRMKINPEIKDETLRLLCYINSHDDFFNSFSEQRRATGQREITVERLLYDIYTEAMAKEYGFLYIFKDKKDKIKIGHSFDGRDIYTKIYPSLVIDLYEHTYFNDYGFKKDKFLKNALSHLDISRLYEPLDNQG